MRCYSHLLTGALSPKVKDAKSDRNITIQASDIANLTDKAIAILIARLYYLYPDIPK